MEEATKKGVSAGAVVGIVLLSAIVFGGGAYAYVNNKATKEKEDLTAQVTELQSQVSSGSTATTASGNSTSTTATTSETASWKVYSNSSLGISFKYPSDWYIKEAPSESRIYVRNTQNDVNKETKPSNFQQIWISYSATESAISRENNTKSGNPDDQEISGSVTPSTIKADDTTIKTYEYSTMGGPTLEAYWADVSGERYWATNSTEVGETNQQNMVANLKLILSTFQFTETGEAKAKESCQSLAGSGATVTITKYVNGASGEFASCGYENATTILKNVSGTWTKIWRGNGDVTCTVQKQYDIPDSIIAGKCV